MISKLIKNISNKSSGISCNSTKDNISPLDPLFKQGLREISYCEENDIFIASYPKSGVTWLQHMTSSLIYGFDASSVPDNLVNLLIPDVHSFKYYLRTCYPVVFKSHSLPEPRMKRVVHLVRDGRDVMVSYFHMLRNQGKSIKLEDMVINSNDLYPCDWGQHCEQWLKNPFNADILRISYEEMINNPFDTIFKYSNFLGIDVSEEKINNVIQKSSFHLMQKKEISQGWGEDFNLNQGLFIRRGKVGSYIDEMELDIQKMFFEKNQKILQALGYC
jgi:hypothetical protein